MAIVRKKDLKALNATELKAKLTEMESLIMSELNAMKSSGRPNNSGKYHEAKKLKSRILTFLTQKEVKAKGTGNPKKNKEPQGKSQVGETPKKEKKTTSAKASVN